MPNPYRELFAAPGTTGFTVAALIARISVPMAGIGSITMLSQLRGSYGLAGAVAATSVLTYAFVSPQISRLVDRHGQHKVLPIATVASIVGITMLVACAHWNAPDWTLFIGAALTGFIPSMSAMVRARWTAIYRGHPRLQTAYSFESVLDEVTYIAGPPLSVALSVALSPGAGLLGAASVLAIGMFAFVSQRGTEPPVERPDVDAPPAGSAIRLPDIRLLTFMMVGMGAISGTVDIVSVALAVHQGNPAAASYVLSAYAVGSCLAGFLFGAHRWVTPLHRVLLLGGLGTAATTLPFLLVTSTVGLSAAVFAAGLFFAPTMIVAMSLVERIVPERQLTEGTTWLIAGLGVGVAVGASASGRVVDAYGARAGFGVAIAAGAEVLVLALWCHRRLKTYSRATVGMEQRGLPFMVADSTNSDVEQQPLRHEH